MFHTLRNALYLNFSDLENRLVPLMNTAELAKSQSMDHLPPWVVTLIGL
jgi:hypothetical protein